LDESKEASMALTLQERLKQKGWPDQDINYALKILKKTEGEKRTDAFGLHLAPITYWIALVITIIGNIVIALAFIPVLFYFSGLFLYVMIASFGLTFGTLYNFIINHMDSLEQKNNVIIAGVFIPAIAIITTGIMVVISNDISTKLRIDSQDPILISVDYVLAFIAPYLLQKIIDTIQSYRKKSKVAF